MRSILYLLLFQVSTLCNMSKNVWSFTSIVENNGLEPLTPCLQNRHSILLNYKTEGLPEDSPRSCRTYLHSLILFCLHSKKEISVQEETQPSRHLNITPLGMLQKGGVPAAPSGTATLLRLSPNHRFYPRPTLAVTDFRHPRLSWLDGRCVQGPGTYSPRRG